MAPLTTTLEHYFLFPYNWIRCIVLFLIPRKVLFKDISKETVLITGAGNGLGRALALELSKNVSQLVLWDIDKRAVKETAELVKNDGGKCYFYGVDVADAQNVLETAEKVKDEVGKVDILVNNAGVAVGKKVLDLTEDEIRKTFNVNTFAHYWLYKAFLPGMIAENHGHLVTVTSAASFVAGYRVSDYVASKSASTALFEALSIELKQDGHNNINFTLVCPYWMSTDMFKGASSKFMNSVHPVTVAQEIVKAIRSNQEMLVVPKLLRPLLCLGAFLPFSSRYSLYVALGFDSFMDSFSGRST